MKHCKRRKSRARSGRTGLSVLHSSSLGSVQGRVCRSVKCGVGAEVGCFERDLLDCDRLGPAAGLGDNRIEKLSRWTKHAAAENKFLRVKYADQIGGRHSPELDCFR